MGFDVSAPQSETHSANTALGGFISINTRRESPSPLTSQTVDLKN